MKHLNYCLCAFFLISFCSAFAQPSLVWQETIGGSQEDLAKYTMLTSDGNLLIVGTTFSNDGDMSAPGGSTGSDRDLFAAKVSMSSGTTIWKRSYSIGSNNDDASNSIIAYEDDTGYILVSDREDGGVTQNNVIYKVGKSDGVYISGSIDYSTGDGYTCITPFLGISDNYLVGSSYQNSARIYLFDYSVPQPSSNVFVDNTGVNPWGQNVKKIIPTTDGGYLVFGEGLMSTQCGEIQYFIWICKLNSSLFISWSKAYGGDTDDIFLDAELGDNGNFYLLGRTTSFCSFGSNGPSNVGFGEWIVEMNAFGNPVQSPRLMDIGNGQAEGIGVADDGRILVAGTIFGVGGGIGYLGKYTYANNQLTNEWEAFGYGDVIEDVEEMDNGNIFCYGATYNNFIPNFWLALFGSQVSPNCDDALPLACDQGYTNHSTSGQENNFNSGNYSSCYSGNDSYNGNDRIYALSVDLEGQYKVVVEMLNGADLDVFMIDECNIPDATGTAELTLVPECIASSTARNNETQTDIEILDVYLTPGTYYIIVDAPSIEDVGNYNISVSCECSCTEPPNNSPQANVYLCENFEDMEAGLITSQSSRWRRWQNDNANYPSADVIFNNNNNVLHVQRNGSISPDVIYQLENQFSGRYRMSWNMWIEEGFEGYYNVLHGLPNDGGEGADWAYHVYFNLGGVGEINAPENNAAETLAQFTYQQGSWTNVVNIIDIDQDQAELWINHELVATWRFSRSSIDFTSNDVLAGINFFATSGDDYYIDDMCIWERETCFYPDIYDPVCISNGQIYTNEDAARCDLYIAGEWGNCFTVCDKGGMFIYRGETFIGTLSQDDLLPGLVTQESCVLDEYGGQLPNVPLKTDILIFYNDDYNDSQVDVVFNTGDDLTKAFVFACDCGAEEFCFQECLGEVNDFTDQDISDLGFYYVLVIGPEGIDYNITIVPDGPCGSGAIPLLCNSTINGQLGIADGLLSMENNFDVLNDNGDYSSCYSGQRTYEGNDDIYRIDLDEPSVVDLTLTSVDAEMGMFLYSFLCGRDCIGYAETTISDGLGKLDSIPLSTGTYYLVVDKNAGSGGNYTLEINCPTDDNYLFQTVGLDSVFFTCNTNQDSIHELHINKDADSNGGIDFLNTNTAIIFMNKIPGGEQRPVYTAYWNNPNDFMPFLIPEDEGNNTVQCSYLSGDSIYIRVFSDQNAGTCNITFDDIQNTPGIYTPGKLSVISGLELESINSFNVSPSYLSIPAYGANAGIGEHTITVGGGTPWVMEELPEVDWLEGPPESGSGHEIVFLTIQENTSQLPREAILRTTFFADSTNYYRFTVIKQKGACLPAEVDIQSSAPMDQICVGESLSLTAIPVPPLEPQVYDYAWNTGATTQSIFIQNALNGAQYSVTITDRNCGETDVQNFTLNLQGGPQTPVSQGDKDICFGDNTPVLIVNNITPGTTVEWYNTPVGGTILEEGELYQVPNNLITTPGTYTFYVQARNNNNDCISAYPREEIRLIVHELPDVVLSGDDLICEGAQGMLTVNATSENPPLNYSWSNGASNTDFIEIPALDATYTVTVTDGENCSTESSISVTLVEAPEIILMNNYLQNPLCGQMNGALRADLIGGQPPFNYLWSNGSTTETIDNLAAGVYAVTVIDANSCPSEANITLEGIGGPSVELSPNQMICQGETIQLEAVASGGTGDYTYQWSDGAGTSSMITVAPQLSNVYTVTVTDENNCPVTGTINVTVIEEPQIQISGNTTICAGEVAYITLGGIGISDYTCLWGDVEGNCTRAFQPGQDTSFAVRLMDNITGCIAETNVVITVVANPELSITGSNVTDCNAATAFAIATVGQGSGNYSYLWSTGATVNILPNLDVGEYSVTVTDNVTGCSESATTTVVAAESPEVNLYNDLFQNAACGQSNGVLYAEVSGGAPPYDYTWSNGLSGAMVANLSPGIYFVTVIDSRMCSVVAQAEIENEGGPDLVINGGGAICLGETIQLEADASGGTGNLTYQWSDGEGTNATISVSPTANKVYTVTVTDENNCSITEEAMIVVNNLPEVQIVGDTAICAGDITQISLEGIGIDNYSCTWPNCTQFFQLDDDASYLVSLTDENTNCETQVLVEINVYPELNFTTSSMPTDCGQETGSAAVMVEGGAGNYSYLWNTNATTSTIENLTEGVYTVTVTDGAGCEVSANIVVSSAEAPMVNLDNNLLQDANCGMNNGMLYAEVSGGMPPYTYNWSNGSTEVMAENLTAGVYFVTVIDASMCPAIAQAEVEDIEGPSLVINGGGAICLGQSIQLEASGSGGTGTLSYEWSDGEGSNPLINVSPNQDKTFSVTVTDENNCTATTEVMVVVNQLPEVQIVGDTAICAGEITEISLEGVGITDYSCTWPNCTQLFQPFGNESYLVTLRDDDTNCETQVVVDINVYEALSLSTSSMVSDCQEGTGAASVLVEGGTGDYTYQWSNGETTDHIENLFAGSYSVTVTDTAGCTEEDDVLVENPDAPVLNFPNNPPACVGDLYNLGLVVSEGLPPYQYNWNEGLPDSLDPQILLTASTTFMVTVTDANGCITEEATFVEVYERPSIDLQHLPFELCEGDTATLLPVFGGDWSSVSWGTSEGGMLNDPLIANPVLEITDGTVNEVVLSLVLSPVVEGVCDAAVDAHEVIVHPLPILESPVILCASDLMTYTVEFSSDADTVIVMEGIITKSGQEYEVTAIDTSENLVIILIDYSSGCENIIEIDAPSCSCEINSPMSLGDVMVCESGAIPPLEVAVEEGMLINWYDDEGILLEEYTDGSYNASSTGVYYAQAFDPVSGCTSEEQTEVFLVIMDAGDAIISGIDQICPGDDVLLSAQGSYSSLLWSTGESDVDVISVNPEQASNTYFVIPTLDGCIGDTAFFDVTLFETEEWSIEEITTIECFGGDNGAIIIQGSNNGIPILPIWNTNDTSIFLNNVIAGQYEVVFTDMNDCMFNLEYVLSEPSEIQLSNIVATPEVDETGNGLISFDISGGTPNYQINLRRDAVDGNIEASQSNVTPGNVIFTELEAGSYFVEVTDGNICKQLFEDEIEIDTEVNIEDVFLNVDWNVFPNPTTGQVYLAFNQTVQKTFEVNVINIIGENVYRLEKEHSAKRLIPMDLSYLPTGVYLILLNIDGKVLSKRLVIE